MFWGIDIVTISPYLKYPLLFILAVVEGPFIMTFAGFLLKLGVLSFIPTFISLGLGDIVGDMAWYGLGYWGGKKNVKRLGKYLSMSESLIEKIEATLVRYQGRIIFFSKVTNGFGFGLATLIAAGIAKISPKRFLLYNFLGEFIWLGLLLFIGHSLGRLYLSLNKGFDMASTIAGFIVLALVLAGFANYMRNYFKNNKF